MVDLLNGKSHQDGFEAVAKPQELIDAIQTMSEEDADELVAKVQEEIRKKGSAKEIIDGILSVAGKVLPLF